jgi:tagatose 1,6-diphosphate aldolase
VVMVVEGARRSLGKSRGLQRVFGAEGLACVLAVDHGQSFASQLEWLLGRTPTSADIAQEKRRMLRYLAPIASGVVCDPEISLPIALSEDLVPPDRAVIVGLPDVRLDWREADGWPWPDFSVADAKRAGCDAVKICILAGVNGAGADKVHLANDVGKLCQEYEIAYILEIVAGDAYTARSGERIRRPEREQALTYVEEFRHAGADLLKLRLPAISQPTSEDSGDVALAVACRQVSARSSVPWALLSAGTRFDVFERDLEIACRAGASGFVAGTAVWQEALEIRDTRRREGFLAEVGAGRLDRLRHIALACGRRVAARPKAGSEVLPYRE